VTAKHAGLRASGAPLPAVYDCAMLDLDGVVYRGGTAIDGVSDLLERVRNAGMKLAFVTNNAARTPEAVAAQLRELGVQAETTDVVTSAQAAAREVSTRVEKGSAVLVVGGEGLDVALRELGLRPVHSAADSPSAVVQGFHPDVGWRQLAEASYVVTSGVPWVASNLDLTIPTADGIAPGNGTLVGAVASAVGHAPDVVAGKPHRPLFDETITRIGAEHPIVVGDRLDTDIEGANTCGAHSLLVMTGVTDLAALCRAGAEQRPTYVAWTLGGLLAEHAAPARREDSWQLGGWSVTVHDAALEVETTGADRNAGLRAVVSAAWSWYDDLPPKQTEGDLDIGAASAALRLP
jgi:glycerol 3-phosphatase-2